MRFWRRRRPTTERHLITVILNDVPSLLLKIEGTVEIEQEDRLRVQAKDGRIHMRVTDYCVTWGDDEGNEP